MFCPQCGQQQVSGDVRFCPRCGFQLSAVMGLLATGGLPTAPQQGEGAVRSPRAQGVRRGGLMILLGLIFTPLFAILHEAIGLPELLIVLSAIVFFWGGILRLVYALVFQAGAPKHAQFAPPYMPPAQINFPDVQTRGAMPPAQSTPVRDYMPPRHRASELAPPPSVTENTTRLLDELPNSGERKP